MTWTKKANSGDAPNRLSKEELRGSRLGLLGRFPAEDIYEPEESADVFGREALNSERLDSLAKPKTA